MRKTLLIADDNRDAVFLFETFLSQKYQAFTTFTGAETLASMRSVLFDVVVLDLSYPDMPMAPFIAEIEKIEKRPPIVVLTGWSLQDVLPRVAALAPRAVLQKPVLATELMEVLNGIVG